MASESQQFEESVVEQRRLENFLTNHRPRQSEVHGELECPRCNEGAPCDQALSLMKRIGEQRKLRIRLYKGILG